MPSDSAKSLRLSNCSGSYSTGHQAARQPTVITDGTLMRRAAGTTAARSSSSPGPPVTQCNAPQPPAAARSVRASRSPETRSLASGSEATRPQAPAATGGSPQAPFQSFPPRGARARCGASQGVDGRLAGAGECGVFMQRGEGGASYPRTSSSAVEHSWDNSGQFTTALDRTSALIYLLQLSATCCGSSSEARLKTPRPEGCEVSGPAVRNALLWR
jgi:hypothetical protein